MGTVVGPAPAIPTHDSRIVGENESVGSKKRTRQAVEDHGVRRRTRATRLLAHPASLAKMEIFSYGRTARKVSKSADALNVMSPYRPVASVASTPSATN